MLVGEGTTHPACHSDPHSSAAGVVANLESRLGLGADRCPGVLLGAGSTQSILTLGECARGDAPTVSQGTLLSKYPWGYSYPPVDNLCSGTFTFGEVAKYRRWIIRMVRVTIIEKETLA